MLPSNLRHVAAYFFNNGCCVGRRVGGWVGEAGWVWSETGTACEREKQGVRGAAASSPPQELASFQFS